MLEKPAVGRGGGRDIAIHREALDICNAEGKLVLAISAVLEKGTVSYAANVLLCTTGEIAP